MFTDLRLIIFSVTVLGALLLAYLIVRRLFTKKPPAQVTIQAIIERIQEMAELVAMSLHFKEIVTHKDPDKGWWIFKVKGKKMILVVEFDATYSYDLRKVTNAGTLSAPILQMPSFSFKVNFGSFSIYDEQPGTFMRIPINRFSTEERNELFEQARTQAANVAKEKSSDLASKVEASAEKTLRGLFQIAGVGGNVQFRFFQEVETETHFRNQMDILQAA